MQKIEVKKEAPNKYCIYDGERKVGTAFPTKEGAEARAKELNHNAALSGRGKSGAGLTTEAPPAGADAGHLEPGAGSGNDEPRVAPPSGGKRKTAPGGHAGNAPAGKGY